LRRKRRNEKQYSTLYVAASIVDLDITEVYVSGRAEAKCSGRLRMVFHDPAIHGFLPILNMLLMYRTDT
jgi:hypothetical protein